MSFHSLPRPSEAIATPFSLGIDDFRIDRHRAPRSAVVERHAPALLLLRPLPSRPAGRPAALSADLFLEDTFVFRFSADGPCG